jgi:hypothetical protein
MAAMCSVRDTLTRILGEDDRAGHTPDVRLDKPAALAPKPRTTLAIWLLTMANTPINDAVNPDADGNHNRKDRQ